MVQQKKFNKIYSKYYELIITFIYKLTGDLDLSKDITQEVFINYSTHIDTVENEKSWLLAVAKNKCYELYRKNNREDAKIEKLKEQENESAFSDYYDTIYEIAELYSETELERKAFILNAEGFTFEEIAKEIPSTFNKVRYALKKIKDRIRFRNKDNNVNAIEDLIHE